MVVNRSFGPLFGLALAAAALQPGAALAQAWLPDEGTLSYAFTFNDTLNRVLYLANGDEVDVGHTRARSYASAGLVQPDGPVDVRRRHSLHS